MPEQHATFADYLAVLQPHVPSQLVAPASFAEIRRRVAPLPAALTSYFCFESRLAAEASQSDLQFSVAAGSDGQLILAGRHDEAAMPADWIAQSNWQQVQRFARFWQEMPPEHVPHLFLGIDCDPNDKGIPSPLLHVRTEKRSADDVRRLVRLVIGDDSSAALAATLDRCLIQAIPAYFAQMFGRSIDGLRLTQPLPVADALPYLDAIGWPGDRERARRLLDMMARWTTHVGLSLNVGAEVGSYLGLELYNWTKPASNHATWQRCLQSLVEQELCTPEKRDSLLSWPGIIHDRSHGWVESLGGTDEANEILHVLLSPARCNTVAVLSVASAFMFSLRQFEG